MYTTIGKDITKAGRILEEGKLVAIPTETVYGLGANALNKQAVASIFEAKNRPEFDPLIVHLSSFEKAKKFVKYIPDFFDELAKRFCPGPLTFVLPKQSIIPDIVTSGQLTVAIRIPDHPMTLQLLEQLDLPIAAPSANPFGYVSPTTAQHVKDQLGGKLPYIMDGGPCDVGLESTIVRMNNDQLEVLREGAIAYEDLKSVYNHTTIKTSSKEQTESPGQLKSHYAPANKFLLGRPEDFEVVNAQKTGFIGFLQMSSKLPEANQMLLSEEGDIKEAAANLFHTMRVMDQKGFDLVIAEKGPNEGIGRAINDRLEKAAHKYD